MDVLQDKLRIFNPGELDGKCYASFVTDFIIKNQLLDRETWKLFVNQYRYQTDVDNRWRGEYWGKMMRGASLCYSCTKNEKLYAVLRETVLDLLSVAESDGRLSSYPRDREFDGWDLWGRKYVMLGFIYFYEICKSKKLKEKIIKVVSRHLDYIIDHVGDGENKKDICKTTQMHGGLNSCSILEPVVKTYILTGKQNYLDFATYIVKKGFCADADYIKLAYENILKPYQYPYKKAYEMMSCFQGLLEYYKVVKSENYLIAVLNFFNAVSETDLTIAGSCGCDGEMFDNSSLTQTEPGRITEWEDGYMQETCVTVTWMNLCFTLLKFTGNAKYAEYLENSSLNAMYGTVNTERQPMKKARSYDLDITIYKKPRESFPFDSYSPLFNDRRGKGIGGFIPLQNGRSYGCCACIGSAGVAIAELYLAMRGLDGFYINGYANYAIQTEFGGEKVKIKMNANLYKNGRVKLKVSGGKFKLYFRIPKWSDTLEVLIDGKVVICKREMEYAVVERDWNDTEIFIFLNASLKKVELNGKVAITKGPIVLSRDERFGEDIAEPISLGRSLRGKQIKNNKFKSNVTFQIKTKNGDVTMCDYSSAGKAFDEDNARLSVWMCQK